jgi:LacI family transcriptional regulator
MVTISDIAKASGVTHATVSRILNNRNKEKWPAAAERAERIRQLAQQMGYRPNAAARSIQSGRTDCLALVEPTGPYLGMVPAGILTSLERQFHERGYHFTAVRCPAEGTSPDQWPRIFRERLIDGAVLDGWDPIPEMFVSQLQTQRLPVVTIRAKLAHDAVYIDELDAGRKSAEHLLSLGHRRIQFIDFGWEGHYEDVDRRQGYRAAMQAAGLTPDFQTVIYHDGEVDHVDVIYLQVEAAERILRRGPDRPTAIIAGHPGIAKSVQGAALRLGMRLPLDLSLITFGDFYVTGALPITTVLSDMGEVGAAAAEMLFAKLADPAGSTTSVVHRATVTEARSTTSPADVAQHDDQANVGTAVAAPGSTAARPRA